jgi:hypothetical protein
VFTQADWLQCRAEMHSKPERAMRSTRSRKATGPAGARTVTGHPLQPVIEALRLVILAADDRIKEGVKWNAPSFYTTEHFATFYLRAPDKVLLILHLGAKPRPGVAVRSAVGESSVPLEWRGATRAIAAFRSVADVQRHTAAFTQLVRLWIEHVR